MCSIPSITYDKEYQNYQKSLYGSSFFKNLELVSNLFGHITLIIERKKEGFSRS